MFERYVHNKEVKVRELKEKEVNTKINEKDIFFTLTCFFISFSKINSDYNIYTKNTCTKEYT